MGYNRLDFFALFIILVAMNKEWRPVNFRLACETGNDFPFDILKIKGNVIVEELKSDSPYVKKPDLCSSKLREILEFFVDDALTHASKQKNFTSLELVDYARRVQDRIIDKCYEIALKDEKFARHKRSEKKLDFGTSFYSMLTKKLAEDQFEKLKKINKVKKSTKGKVEKSLR